MKMPQWWWDIEDTLIEWGFRLCIAAMLLVVSDLIYIAVVTTPGFLRAFGFIS
jgi:hypothetical protein